ncbi:MAG: hypothetical protein JW940_10380 [Polyangiaceae bacterium]|nr:hypothetical protein [Polyangiaceae bacterium]
MTGTDSPRTPDCLPPVGFEHLLARVGEGALFSAWAAHVDQCASCAQRLAEARQMGDAYLGSSQARELRERLLARLGNRPRAWKWIRPALGGGLAAAAAASIAVMVRSPGHGTDKLEPATQAAWQAKGAGVVTLTVQRGERSWAWDGSPLEPGDRFQLGWLAPRSGYLAVLGRKRDGETLVLFPEEGSESASVGGGSAVPLGRSVVAARDLDGLGLISLFSGAPFALDPWQSELRRRGVLEATREVQIGRVELAVRSQPP